MQKIQINLDSFSLEEQAKIGILLKIAKKFNEDHIIWALGGSLMLRFKGLNVSFNDIDIIIGEESINFVEKSMNIIGEKLPERDKGIYSSLFFDEYKIDNCDVDVMSEVSLFGSEYVLSLKREDIDCYLEINDVRIPLHSLRRWRELYVAIGRSDKIKIIDDFTK